MEITLKINLIIEDNSVDNTVRQLLNIEDVVLHIKHGYHVDDNIFSDKSVDHYEVTLRDNSSTWVNFEKNDNCNEKSDCQYPCLLEFGSGLYEKNQLYMQGESLIHYMLQGYLCEEAQVLSYNTEGRYIYGCYGEDEYQYDNCMIKLTFSPVDRHFIE